MKFKSFRIRSVVSKLTVLHALKPYVNIKIIGKGFSEKQRGCVFFSKKLRFGFHFRHLNPRKQYVPIDCKFSALFSLDIYAFKNTAFLRNRVH